MSLPIKIVSRSKSTEEGAATSKDGGKWKYPHLVSKLSEHFKHSSFRSDLQRKAVEAAVQGNKI